MEKPKINFQNLTLDGAMGSLLISRSGVEAGYFLEKLNIENPKLVTNCHKDYVDAGADIVYANTFGANSYKFGNELKDIIEKGIENARKANPKFVALDIGPLGKIVGSEIDFEQAVSKFSEIINFAKDKTDMIVIETMTNLQEARAAVIACKENSNLPILVSMSFERGGRTFFGNSIECFATTMENLGVSAIGANCSLGPIEMYDNAIKLVKNTALPIFIKPNAGMPKLINGKTVYDISDIEFAFAMKKISKLGINILGGCCGTTPDYIKQISKYTKNAPKRVPYEYQARVCSQTQVVNFSDFRAIGERLNPTGKKRLKKALVENDFEYILSLGIEQVNQGADILDVNCGLGEIDEKATMLEIVKRLCQVTNAPLQIDSTNAETIESALRVYAGKAIVNSVNGEDKSIHSVMPIASKYGASIVALLLDENGIPKTVEDRIKIANKILKYAEAYGIHKEDILFDALTLSEASESGNALLTLNTVKALSDMGLKTVLGVSNISFGMPNREDINAKFLELAKANGLTSAIINPKMLGFVGSDMADKFLSGQDGVIEDYIAYATNQPKLQIQTSEKITLIDAVINGQKETAETLTRELLSTVSDSMEIAKEYIIPALDEVGKLYEKGTFFLPQLISSADSAKSALKIIEDNQTGSTNYKHTFLIATVKGDIHDIGKNIVKAVVSNFGYKVIDLGRDVSYDKVLDSVKANYPCSLGLSALMTTTAQNMAETIKIVRKDFPNIKIFVGGAVLTEQFAFNIGGIYCKDAMETVKKLNEFFGD